MRAGAIGVGFVELTLLGTAGLVAFIVGGAAVMLIAAFRRTIALRKALGAAFERIERLEGLVAEGGTARIVMTTPEALAAHAAAQAQIGAAQVLLPPYRSQAHAPAPEAPQEKTAPAQHAETSGEAVAPPQFGVAAAISALAAFAALAGGFAQVVSAALSVVLAVGVGLAVLGAAEWRLRANREAHAMPRLLGLDRATLTALYALGLIAAALLFGRYGLGAPSPLGGFIGLAACALCACLLSLRFDAWLMFAGALGAAGAPLLAPRDAAGSIALYAFLFVFAGVAGFVARRYSARVWAWTGGAIGLGWGAAATFVVNAGADFGAAAIFFTGLFALGLAYAWRGSAAPAPTFPLFWAEPTGWREPLVAGLGAAALAGALLIAVALATPAPGAISAACIAAMAGLAGAAAFARPGYWPIVYGAALLSSLALATWPASGSIAPAPMLLLLAGGLGLIFSACGALMMTRPASLAAGANFAALAPVLVFASLHWRIGADFASPLVWACVGAVIGVLNAVTFVQLGKGAKEAARPFLAGATVSATLALYALAPANYAPLVLAMAIPALAFADLLKNEAGLRYAALVLGGLLVARLIGPQFSPVSASAPTMLALQFATASAGLVGAARLFDIGPAEPDSRAAQYSFAFGLVCLASGASLALRHAATAGAIGAPYASLIEMGANTFVWLALAMGLCLRFDARARAPLAGLELVAFAGAGIHMGLVGLVAINPWWGLAPAPAPGAPGFNAVEAGYLAPGLAFLAYAYLCERQQRRVCAGASLAAGLCLIFVAVILEIRRLMHGAAMASAPLSVAEAWAYSLATLGFAAFLAALAAGRDAPILRMSALGLGIAAIGKMAIFDTAGLDGFARYGAMIVFIIGGGAFVMFSRRFLVRLASPGYRGARDPNLMPPA